MSILFHSQIYISNQTILNRNFYHTRYVSTTLQVEQIFLHMSNNILLTVPSESFFLHIQSSEQKGTQSLYKCSHDTLRYTKN